MRKRIYLPQPMLHPDGEELLRKECDIVLASELDEADRGAALASAHGFSGGVAVDAALMDRAPNLEVIGFPGSGYEAIDVAAATDRGICVVYAAGSQYTAVAEHALGLALSVAKRIGYSDRFLHREKRFIDRSVFTGDGWPGFPHEISGKTVGLLGFGFIGRDLARKCRAAFDMRVLAYDPYFDPVEAERQGVTLYRTRSELPQLLAQSDFVVLCLPLNDETHHILGAAELEAMRSDAVLINVSRGGTVDEVALEQALRTGAIAGAGLDVFDPEPTRDNHPLFDLENVVLTPHIGGWVEEALPRLAVTAAREMLMVLRGERPTRIANPQVWDDPSRRVRGIEDPQ
ncbi:hydroxyacid dehydrogenase [Myxococcota bacterium]|nr:hydroxyacid dehydrogenase [Myxococcota bacterium]